MPELRGSHENVRIGQAAMGDSMTTGGFMIEEIPRCK